MEFILADLIFSGIGRACLFLSVRKKARIREVLRGKYNNSYTDAGRILCFRLFAWVLAVLLLAFLLVVVFRAFFPVE